MNTQTPTQAVTKPAAKPAPTLRQQLAGDYFKQQIALALPKHMTADRMIRVALTAIMRTPKLLECTPDSVMKCMLDCSALGLEPDGRRAHLIPFNDKKKKVTVCTLVIDYKGLAELCFNSGTISSIHADVVCENDEFIYDTGEVKVHKIDLRKPRGKKYAAYCIIKFRDGGEKHDAMSQEEIYAVRDKSSGWRAHKDYGVPTPWADPQSEPEMWKKTVFKRASKWVKLSPEIIDVIEKDDAASDVVPATSPVIDLSQAVSAPLQEPESSPDQEPEHQGEPKEDEDQAPGAEAPAEPTPTAKTNPQKQSTVHDTIREAVEGAGYTFRDFIAWGAQSGNIPDADSIPDWDGVPVMVARRLARATAGLVQGIKVMKQEEKGAQ